MDDKIFLLINHIECWGGMAPHYFKVKKCQIRFFFQSKNIPLLLFVQFEHYRLVNCRNLSCICGLFLKILFFKPSLNSTNFKISFYVAAKYYSLDNISIFFNHYFSKLVNKFRKN